MKTNPHITSVRVARAIARQERDRADQDLVHRHQSALRTIDQIESALRTIDQIEKSKGEVIRDFVSSRGPRTGTHPMATRIEPEPPRPMATRTPPPMSALGVATTVAVIGSAIMAAIWMAAR